ncbi:hypothetical protein ABNN70_11210 [Sporolactobacillus sp. Y61]|uniref:Uncharacterized protein n=1 Tax=Sporolactobacillus sp. Y61 TaxID=3160863 RepID=A0AAU8IDH0_9BACL|nr:hypothetical protein [Sporolactobacillus sp. THM19-2]
MIQYEFDEITFDSGSKTLIIKTKNREKYLVATFLMSDIQGGDPSYALDKFEAVLDGRLDYAELNGNVCGVEIHKDKTQIYDNLADDGKGDWCEVNTKDLRDLIVIWAARIKKYREKNPN